MRRVIVNGSILLWITSYHTYILYLLYVRIIRKKTTFFSKRPHKKLITGNENSDCQRVDIIVNNFIHTIFFILYLRKKKKKKNKFSQNDCKNRVFYYIFAHRKLITGYEKCDCEQVYITVNHTVWVFIAISIAVWSLQHHYWRNVTVLHLPRLGTG